MKHILTFEDFINESIINEATMNFSPKDVIGNSTTINGLEIAEFDLPMRMSYKDAEKAVKKLGDGWRIPSTAEVMYILEPNKKTLNLGLKPDNFGNALYWAPNELYKFHAWDFSTGKMLSAKGISNKWDNVSVRPVKGLGGGNYSPTAGSKDLHANE